MGTRADKRFTDFRLEMHGEIVGVRGEIGELPGTQKLQSRMLGVLVATVLLPVSQSSLDFFQRLLAVAPGPSLVCQGSAYIKPPVMCG